jgi:serine/threonine protein kinase
MQTGLRVGDFEIEGHAGSGGMGIVYVARQVSLDRKVALKILGSALDDEDGRARFRREAQAIAKLDHPGIARVHYIGQEQHVCYIAMEYIDGVPLRVILTRSSTLGAGDLSVGQILKPSQIDSRDIPDVRFDQPDETEILTPKAEAEARARNLMGPTAESRRLMSTPEFVRRCCEIIRDAALALAHAHERGVVHRDIKPENLLVDRDGGIHIIDFGLARFYEDMTLTNTGALLGTPMYMSPEQVSGRFKLDHRTDIYSLGLVLYEMLILSRPIRGATRENVLRQIMTKSRPPLMRMNQGVSRELEAVTHKAIAHDPDERYQSATAFAEDLQKVIDHKTVSAAPYRYKADLREIAAERPRSVSFVSVAFLSGTTLLLLMLVLPYLAMFTIKEARPYMTWFGFYLVLIILPLILSSAYFFQGYSWAKWVMSFYLFLSFVFSILECFYFIINDYYFYVIFITLVFSLFSMILLVVLHRRETTDWLRLARRLREEHKALGSGR